ncbi:hypothetical protein LTR36_002978 [Oleoguttula mirabilis]|uniref:Integral membrane protein n=1 Tax=Oleoguttula mirabilis TaxID=1507867 RepID=A0AAV9JXX5_9PEZI|nr:hypothetical protein LTR36_002978 [Oleoguttula mirabilis]
MPSSYVAGSRFSEYTPTDHQTALWITTSLSLVYSFLILLVRLAAKYKSLGLDDAALGLAYAASLAQWTVVYKALGVGAGKDVTRWKIVTAVDVCFEAAMVLVPAYVFSKLQMSFKRKVTVISAFSFRIGVAILFIVYFKSYMDFRLHGKDSIGAVNNIVLQQTLIAYSLISATIPCLKGFLGRFQTGDLARLSEGGTRYAYGTRGGTHSESYALSLLDRDALSRRRPAQKHRIKLQPASVEHMAMASGGDNASASVRSFGSEQMIIHKRTEFDVVSQ